MVYIVDDEMEVETKMCGQGVTPPLVLGVAVRKENSALPQLLRPRRKHPSLFLSPDSEIPCDPPPHSIRTAHPNHPFKVLPRLCTHHRLWTSG